MRAPVFASAAADSASAPRSRPQIDTAAPSEASRCAMARPMPRLPPVTSATAPDIGVFFRVSVFIEFMRAMRILPRTGHYFYATLILSLEFSAARGSPGGSDSTEREVPAQ